MYSQNTVKQQVQNVHSEHMLQLSYLLNKAFNTPTRELFCATASDSFCLNFPNRLSPPPDRLVIDPLGVEVRGDVKETWNGFKRII